ncbi:MAG: PQQ-binding-like beta-propeller repeat protein [Verrucomicrobiales bacterium]|nr:PQQ-binding-like beta-propeller repeat protein [Verrucomicrobiales bacterium]
MSNGLVAVDGISGAVRWVAELRPHLRSPVVGWGGTLYVGSADLSEPALYALDTATGEERWRRVCAAPGPGSPVLAEDGSLYVVSGQRLLALDAVSGAKKAEFATAEGEGFSTYPALGDRGLVYLGAGNAVYAFEELGWGAGHGGLAYAPWPAYRGDAQQSGRYSCRAEQAAVRAPAERRVWHEGVAGTVEVRLRPDASLALQWYHDGVAVPGATNPVLTIATVTQADAGWYELVASNVLCQVRAGTFVTTDSTLEPLRFPAWRWEGDGGSVTVELAPVIVGPWTEAGRSAGGENGGVYVETDLRRPAGFYRLRAAEGGGPTRFTASGMIPGWWYQSGVGSRHRIEYVWSGSGWTNWVALPELTLPASPHLFLDTDAFDHPDAVYRTTPVP